MGVQSHWFYEGIYLWLKCTKGQGNSWCAQQSYYLLHELDLVVYTASKVTQQLESVHLTNDQIYHMLSPLLSRAIKNFIVPDNSPNHMELFVDENFN